MKDKVNIRFSKVSNLNSRKCMEVALRTYHVISMALVLELIFKALKIVTTAITAIIIYECTKRILILKAEYQCTWEILLSNSIVTSNIRTMLWATLILLVFIMLINKKVNCKLKDISWALKVKKGVKQSIDVAVRHSIASDVANIILKSYDTEQEEYEAHIEVEDNTIRINGVSEIVVSKRISNDYNFVLALCSGRLDSFDNELLDYYQSIIELTDKITENQEK